MLCRAVFRAPDITKSAGATFIKLLRETVFKITKDITLSGRRFTSLFYLILLSLLEGLKIILKIDELQNNVIVSVI